MLLGMNERERVVYQTRVAAVFVRVVWICAMHGEDVRNLSPSTVRRKNVQRPYLDERHGTTSDGRAGDVLTESDGALTWHAHEALTTGEIVDGHVVEANILLGLRFLVGRSGGFVWNRCTVNTRE